MNGKVDEWIDGWEREKKEVCRPLTRNVKTGGTHAGSLVPRASGVWTTELLRAPGRCAWTRLRTTSGPEPVLPRVRAASWSTQHGVRCRSLVPSGVPTSKPFAPVPASSCDPRPACRIPVENTTARGRPPAGADRTAHTRGLARPPSPARGPALRAAQAPGARGSGPGPPLPERPGRTLPLRGRQQRWQRTCCVLAPASSRGPAPVLAHEPGPHLGVTPRRSPEPALRLPKAPSVSADRRGGARAVCL